MSLNLPPGTTQAGQTTYGWELLLMGWLGLLIFQFGWLANVLIVVIALLRLCGRWRSIGTYVLLLLCGSSALFWTNLPDDSGSNPLRSWDAGYYVWWLSIGLCLLSAFGARLHDEEDGLSEVVEEPRSG